WEGANTDTPSCHTLNKCRFALHPKSRSQHYGRQRSLGGTRADGRASAFLCAALWDLCVCAGRGGHRYVTWRPKRGTT
ncbi:unnamed protein product, partial [Gulo gulo]